MVPVRGNTKRTGRQRLTEQRFGWHCTPKHGSLAGVMWPNPNSAFCPRSASIAAYRTAGVDREVAASVAGRNQNHAEADWQPTTADARLKPKRLYPAS